MLSLMRGTIQLQAMITKRSKGLRVAYGPACVLLTRRNVFGHVVAHSVRSNHEGVMF